MQPVNSVVEVHQSPEHVFDVLSVMSNHALFTDHFLQDWSYSGPRSGVGSQAHVTARLGAKADVDIVVTKSARPTYIEERNTSAAGKRVATGTYTLFPLPTGGTAIRFEYRWISAPWSDRLVAPIVRRVVRKANDKALRRLQSMLSADTFAEGGTIR